MRNSFGDSRPSELTRSTDAVPVAVPPARPSTRVPGVAGVFRNTIIDDTVAFMPPKCRTSTASSSNIPLCFTVYQPHEEVHYEISFAFVRCAFHASWRGRRASLHFVRTCGRAMPSHRRLRLSETAKLSTTAKGSGTLLSAVSRGCGCLHRSIAAVSTAKPPPVREGEQATAIADQVGATQRAHCDSSVGLVEVAWETPSVRGWRASHPNQPDALRSDCVVKDVRVSSCGPHLQTSP